MLLLLVLAGLEEQLRMPLLHRLVAFLFLVLLQLLAVVEAAIVLAV
jgi:hypothetical protein